MTRHRVRATSAPFDHALVSHCMRQRAVAQPVAGIAIVTGWLIYPGVMVLPATVIGACYMAAAVLALADRRSAIWTASLFTTLAAVLATLAVVQFQQSGFSFLSGSHEFHRQFYAVPYLFLLMSIGSSLAVVLYVVCSGDGWSSGAAVFLGEDVLAPRVPHDNGRAIRVLRLPHRRVTDARRNAAI